MIPLGMKLQVRGKDGKGVKLWFPVILVWILVFAVLILIFPLALLFVLITGNREYGKMLFLFYPRFINLLSSLSGLKLDIESGKEKIFMDFK